MKFGMFYELQMPRPWTDTAEYDTLWDAVRQVQYAEEMGFERVWLVEHHFLTEFAHSSAPEVMLAVMAQHTKKMRLGFGVVLAPVHHPLHVAARASTLDILSDGRVDVGVGRTKGPYQLTPFGTDVATTQSMMVETLECLPRMWCDEVFQPRRRELDDSAAGGDTASVAEAASAAVDGVHAGGHLPAGGSAGRRVPGEHAGRDGQDAGVGERVLRGHRERQSGGSVHEPAGGGVDDRVLRRRRRQGAAEGRGGCGVVPGAEPAAVRAGMGRRGYGRGAGGVPVLRAGRRGARGRAVASERGRRTRSSRRRRRRTNCWAAAGTAWAIPTRASG